MAKSSKQEATVLLKITRSESEQIIAQRSSYKDKEYLDIRVNWKPEDKDEFIPTKKGVSIPIEKAEKLARRILKSLRENPPQTSSKEE
jgi:hypothetical protein